MSTIACVSAALGELGLPTTEEVRLISDIVKSFGGPSGMPTFLKKKRKTSRAMTVWDFTRPVETPAERALFFECFAIVAKQGRRIDWTAFAREFNIRAVRTWEATNQMADLYIKEERHLKDYHHQIVVQASQAEVNATTSAIYGLPASASSLNKEALHLRAPGIGDAPSGSVNEKHCKKCEKVVAGSRAKMLGHSCWHYLVAHGKDPMQYDHAKARYKSKEYPKLMSQEEALQWLEQNKNKSSRHPRNRAKRMRDQPVG